MTSGQDRVIGAAQKLFLAQGYRATSMRALAKELGIQAPSIYSHFASKADLLEALILPALRDLDYRLEVMEADHQLTDRSALTGLATYLFNHREVTALCFLDAGVHKHPEHGPAIKQRWQRAERLLAGLADGDLTCARAGLGALLYPILRSEAKVWEQPWIIDAAERALRTS